MKLKHADFPNWERVKKKGYINKYFSNEDFKGNISLLTAKEVKEKLVITKKGKELVLIDNNYKWLEVYPDNNKNIALSAAMDEKDQVIEWYFDIARNTLLTEKGVPYIEDLYLDVILYPSGEIELLDEDELIEALEKNDITKEEFDFAYKVSNDLVKQIEGKTSELKGFTYKYFDLLKI